MDKTKLSKDAQLYLAADKAAEEAHLWHLKQMRKKQEAQGEQEIEDKVSPERIQEMVQEIGEMLKRFPTKL